MKKLLAIALLFISYYSFGQSEQSDKSVRVGNNLYKQQQFDKAAAEYSKAIETDPMNLTAKFNLANTLYKQDKKEDAIKAFTNLTPDIKEADLKSKVDYNKGVTLTRSNKLEESIEAYKDALRQNPNDKDTRENLQKALLELKKRNPPPPKPKEQEKKKQQQQQQKKQQQPKMNQKEAEQRLKLLEQKEKEVQQRMQKEKSKSGGGLDKDW